MGSVSHRSVFAAMLLFVSAALIGQDNTPTASTLTVSFGEKSLTVTGVSPGGRVVVFGVARESIGKPAIPAIVIRAEMLSDSDGDGTVTLQLPVAVPQYGMWAVVDLASGANQAFPTPGYSSPQRVELTPELVRRDSAGQLRKLEWPFGQIDVLVARPGGRMDQGAWKLFASKGSGLDENRGTGKRELRVDISAMTPIGDSPAGPGTLRDGDVVAIFDRHFVRYGIMEVAVADVALIPTLDMWALLTLLGAFTVLGARRIGGG